MFFEFILNKNIFNFTWLKDNGMLFPHIPFRQVQLFNHQLEIRNQN